MAEGSSTSASFRAAERVVLDENRILQALQEDVESDVETGAETDIGSDVDEIEEREDDACRNSDTEQSDEDSENDGPVTDDEIPLARTKLGYQKSDGALTFAGLGSVCRSLFLTIRHQLEICFIILGIHYFPSASSTIYSK
ncbi:hypothetical protein J6590_083108 [Homalodisca vitripennis]|nr:hypothetical protein J6590_083108 [Homalodisca vitripennis]